MANTGYQILKVSIDQATALSNQIATLAGSGWLPLGGAQIDNGFFYQTMIKGDVGGAVGTGDVYTLPAATTGTIGGVKLAAAVADSTAILLATLVTDHNALLASLRTAGVLHV